MSESTPNPNWTDDELRAMDTATAADALELKRDPVAEYIARKERYGREQHYVDSLATILREFEEFLYVEFEEHPCNIDDSHVTAFAGHLQGGEYLTITGRAGEAMTIDLSSRTRYDHLRRVSSFYSWLVDEVGVLSQNPAKIALDELTSTDTFDLAPPDRPHISLDEMAAFLNSLGTPRERAVVLTLLKTGIRVGELINLDLCCLHLDHPLYEHVLDVAGVDLLPTVRDRPDTLVVESGFASGTEVRDEVRPHGSKRQRAGGTVIPVDRELKTALLEYLLVRRRATDHATQARPLFLNAQAGGTNDRLGQQPLYGILTKNADQTGALYEYGWYEPGADTSENVTPHYFRHYFTHNHRHNQGVHHGHMPEDVIAYVRGDAASGDGSARETNYRHDDWNVWERYIKEPYLSGVYQFGVYDDADPRHQSEQFHGDSRGPSTPVTGGGLTVGEGVTQQ